MQKSVMEFRELDSPHHMITPNTHDAHLPRHRPALTFKRSARIEGATALIKPRLAPDSQASLKTGAINTPLAL